MKKVDFQGVYHIYVHIKMYLSICRYYFLAKLRKTSSADRFTEAILFRTTRWGDPVMAQRFRVNGGRVRVVDIKFISSGKYLRVPQILHPKFSKGAI